MRTAGKRSPVGLSVSKLHLYHLEGPQFGELTVQLNGEPYAVLSTDAPERRDLQLTELVAAHLRRVLAVGGEGRER